MSNDNKTLADVRPGGRVRLGDAPWPEIDAILADAYSAGAEGLPFEGIARRAAVRKAVAALSAQPSPGGQDALAVIEELAELNRACAALDPDYKGPTEAAVQTALAALASRQPVGEPVTVPGAPTSCRHCDSTDLKWFAHVRTLNDVQQGRLNTHDVGCVFVLGCEECSETLRVVKADDIAALLNAAPPVHAQDLGQIWQQAFYDTVHSYRRNKSRMWVLQMMKERVQALLDSQAVGNG